MDDSMWPSVQIDVVIPPEYATAEVGPEMIELDGGRTDWVDPVEAIRSVVGLVIDDGPMVPDEVVYNAQGASVELVRNVGEGTAIALSTPSGMLTVPTTDRQASIARIAAMTAGAPDVVPLNRLVLEAARRLDGSAWPDRHLVLVLGRPISEAPTLRELTDILARADIRLHVVADPGIETGEIASLAEETGGVASHGEAMLAEVDDVTAAIAHRVRIGATVTGRGPLDLAVNLDGDRFAAEVDLPAPPSTTPAPTSTATNVTEPGAAAPIPTAGAGTVPPTATAPPAGVSAASEATRRRQLATAAPFVAVALAVVAWLWLRARRRAATRQDGPTPPASRPPARRDPVPTVARAHPAGRAAEPAPEDENRAQTAWLEPDTPDSALTAQRRPPGRPHRATPRRRVTTTMSPPPEYESPHEEEDEPADAAEWLVVGRIRLRRGTGEVFSGTRRISVTPGEFAVLELLMTRGGHGVTRDAIRAAAHIGKNGDELPDAEAILAELRRKTGIRGRGQGVRQERALVYFFGE